MKVILTDREGDLSSSILNISVGGSRPAWNSTISSISDILTRRVNSVIIHCVIDSVVDAVCGVTQNLIIRDVRIPDLN